MQKAPNTACTRLVGVAAFSGRFLCSSRFRQSGVILSRPPAGNARRYAQTGIGKWELTKENVLETSS